MQTPTEPGWYWWTVPEHRDIRDWLLDAGETVCIEVEDVRGTLEVAIWVDECYETWPRYYPVAEIGGTWGLRLPRGRDDLVRFVCDALDAMDWDGRHEFAEDLAERFCPHCGQPQKCANACWCTYDG